MSSSGAGGPPPYLAEHFKGAEPQAHSAKWSELWEQALTPWDRGGPSMALYDLLKENPHGLFSLPGSDSESGSEPENKNKTKRKRALVPGCGRGHDVLLLSSFGYDVYGLDVSAKALEEARANAEKALNEGLYPLVQQQQQKGEGEEGSGKTERGSVTWLLQDFFAQKWEGVEEDDGARFDLIFDYTFFCALPPPMRPSWASRMRSLLAPGGRLVCLEFPTEKTIAEGGPPWAAPPEEYVGYLSNPGTAPRTDEQHGGVVAGAVETPMPGSFKRLLHLKPRRTHGIGLDANGRVKDFISVWTQADELAATLT